MNETQETYWPAEGTLVASPDCPMYRDSTIHYPSESGDRIMTIRCHVARGLEILAVE